MSGEDGLAEPDTRAELNPDGTSASAQRDPEELVEQEKQLNAAGIKSDNKRDTERDDLRQRLRKSYGYGLAVLTVLQLIAADIGFFVYAKHVRWEVPQPVMAVWLSAAVVEVLATVQIVTRALFKD